MKEILLTKEERLIISTIASDNESGGHLLNKRSEDYWKSRKIFSEIYNKSSIELTDKEKDMLEYYNQCSDYNYYISLSEESRMF